MSDAIMMIYRLLASNKRTGEMDMHERNDG